MTDIKTLTCFYEQDQDRIRLAINYLDHMNRIDLWITRRFLLRLLPLFEQFIDTHNETAINCPPIDIKIQNTQQPVSTDNDMLILAQKNPVLLSKVTLSKVNANVKIVFIAESGDKSFCVLTPIELESFAKSLINAAPTYEWGIGPWWNNTI